jgi:hypothetical protein
MNLHKWFDEASSITVYKGLILDYGWLLVGNYRHGNIVLVVDLRFSLADSEVV